MGMTVTEKILAAHSGAQAVHAGELIRAQLDLCLANDITAPLAIQEFEKAGAQRVFDPAKVALIPDHFTPNKDIKSAEQAKYVREFALKHQLVHYYEQGECGVEHALLPEKGIVIRGDCVIGADSHTCTYGGIGAFATGVGSTDLAAGMITGETWFKVPASVKFNFSGKPSRWVTGKDYILTVIGKIGVDGALYQAMEFTGEAIRALSVEGRLTMCNMAIEAGAKSGIVAADDATLAFARERSGRTPVAYASDPDAAYAAVHEFDAGALEPVVALPHLPSNVKPVRACGDLTVDQVVIGSCTNGRIEDFRLAAAVLRGRKVKKGVRVIILPATQAIYGMAMREGLLADFLAAGCVIGPPTCGPCLGGHMGILAAGERAVATTNRNFVGRMGSTKSEVVLASPAVAAASAVTGRLTHPDEVVK
ncbi:MAG TPA: 3-isopropylmalate dehydratase large subunit [bacterium]|nr:3-isopropylmalate dehydratase large subunit [bacterium]